MRPFFASVTYFFLLILTFAVTFLISLEAAAAASPNNKESQLLLNFKSGLPDQSLLQSWLPNQDPCSFKGVTCQDSKVTSIQLSYISLSADFHFVASFLLALENLESLSLLNANISGNISFPSGSKCSALLTVVDLSQNTLSGPLSTVSNLGSCSNLKVLNLSNNNLEFSGIETRGLQLGLEVLDLSFNKISGGNVVQWILYGGCSELKLLSLKGNKISGEINVSNCRNLQFLDLSSNNFSMGTPSFGDCLALEHLDVSDNKLSGDVSRAISSCEKLNFLNISNNQFSGPIPALPTSNLLRLYLAENKFQGEIPVYLTEACSGLVELDVSSNNLSGVIPSGFGSCSSLESFDISNNNFTGKLPIEIIQNMSSLKELGLAFNYFSGPLPGSLSSLSNLEDLDLSSNNFLGLIPASLCENPTNRLQVMYLQNNILTGSIPAALSNCSQLVSLDLSFNYLTGAIPPSLGSLSKLQDLKLWLNQLHGEIPQELGKIKTLETLILDFNELTGIIPYGLSNCTKLNWISLSNNRLSGEIPSWLGKLSNLAILKLSNNSLYGRVPPELGDCQSLIWLDLNTNNLNGTIPSVLFKQSGKIGVNFIAGKRFTYIKNDGSKECRGSGNLLEFAGIRQEQLDRISTRNPCNFTRVYGPRLTQPTFKNNGSMIFLDLSYNFLSGTMPKEIGTLSYLFILNLAHNNISGIIPQEIGDLKGLGILDLSYNRLEGSIPQSMTGITLLSEINLSNNLLSGMIPDEGQLETFAADNFLNNSGLCGVPLPPCARDPAAGSNSDHRKSHRRQASLAGSVAMGLLVALFCIFGLIVAVVETKKRRKKDFALDVYMDSHSHSGTANTSWKLTGAREALSINLATFEKPLRKLTFADLLEATNGFHNDSLIGSGGFGDVYKAQLKDGSVVAIKKLIHISGQGDREFTAEMETIGKIKHRNLVPLLGYCKVGEERLLVYEYMRYGSLEDVLHDPKKAGIKLNWAARRKIAIGAARGLAFLHRNCIPHIIHRDMKSSNVLLDENLEARVSDFGMARLMSAMDTHLSVSTLAGTPGYVPPEYYQSSRCSTKGDVYSYGVVLLELLTGKRPTDSADFGDDNLVGWVKQHAKLRTSDVFDPELVKEDPSLESELLQHLNVACACLDDRPLKRPTMIQVLAMFKEIQAGSELDSQSTIATDDGGFSAVEMVDMTIKEVPEAEPKVRFDSVNFRFWSSLGLSYVMDNDMDTPTMCLLVSSSIGAASVSVLASSNQHIKISFVIDSVTHYVTVVYASVLMLHRRRLWDNLVGQKFLCSHNWLVLGDFNACFGAHENRGGRTPSNRSCYDFRTAMDLCELSCFKTKGLLFTWTNKSHGEAIIEIRLDKAFFNNNSLQYWSRMEWSSLARHESDHNLLLLTCDNSISSSPKPFRFRSMWIDHQKFLDDVSRFWSFLAFHGNLMYVITAKLKLLRGFLREWNRNTFDNVDLAILETQQSLVDIQLEMEQEGFLEELFSKEMEDHNSLSFHLESKRKLLADSCKVKWLKQGDRNSQFFHNLLKQRRARSGINSLFINGDYVIDPYIIRVHIIDFYEELFAALLGPRDFSTVKVVTPSLLTDFDNSFLLQIPSDLDIKETIFDMDPYSAPGPDGFDGLYYKTCSDIVGADVCATVKFFFGSGSLKLGLNSNLIVLIPKCDGADSIDKFQPIVLARKNDICSVVNIHRGQLPFIYLGVPLFVGSAKRRHLQHIADSILSKFSKWKGMTLSMA
ncbi:hypothetical protein DITRI_Ditri18aG0050200 [Diplodiscus trichospermus]